MGNVTSNGETVSPQVIVGRGRTTFDLSRGLRTFVEAEEAEELLRPLTECRNSYTKICFSNTSFGIGAARVAEPILVSVKDQLKDVDLSDIVAGRLESEALEVMNILSSALEGCVLKSLNLSENALGDKGVKAFGGLLKSQNSLEELYLLNAGISVEAAQLLCELIPSTEKLKVLHFHNNMMGDEGAVAISELVKHSPALEDFRCSVTRVTSKGGVPLVNALGSCANLKKLDLRDNMFGLGVDLALANAISSHVALVEVYLSEANLKDEGAIALANALKHSAPALQVLEMATNEITAEAAPALAACITEKHALTKLNLSENELKDEGTVTIGKALKEGHSQLKEVDMHFNQMRRAGAMLLAQVVISKPAFKLLNINENYISNKGIDEVKDIFQKSPEMLGSLDDNVPLEEEEELDESESESEE